MGPAARPWRTPGGTSSHPAAMLLDEEQLQSKEPDDKASAVIAATDLALLDWAI
jgi:hypothetical protein